MAKHPQNESLAVGFNDGTIKLYSETDSDAVFDSEESIVFNGHKSAITSMVFDLEGHRLASGSRDTNIIVWDVVNECGLYRLKGKDFDEFSESLLTP